MEIKETVRAFIQENFYAQDIEDDTSFIKTGIIDSTGVLEFIGFLESTFGIHVEDDEIIPDHLDSLAAIEAFVRRKLAATPAQAVG